MKDSLKELLTCEKCQHGCGAHSDGEVLEKECLTCGEKQQIKLTDRLKTLIYGQLVDVTRGPE